jgi:glucose-1-phosphate cytidylyltransferase
VSGPSLLASERDSVQVVLLCGGLGTRMREETEFRPKPMVEIGGRPLLWHVMKLYAAHGLREFVLCLGYKGADIKAYFANYLLLNSDVTFELGSGDAEYGRGSVEDWRVTLVDTGEDSMTGARVKRVEGHLTGDLFLCTYGDGVADVDISALIAFHRSHGKLATVTGVQQPPRFGQLVTGDGPDRGRVTRFSEKPADESQLINGGFFVFDRAVLDRLSTEPSCVLEHEPLERLAADGELVVFPHRGFWQCADTIRDVELLRGLWQSGDAPWRTWDDRAPTSAYGRGTRRDDRQHLQRVV